MFDKSLVMIAQNLDDNIHSQDTYGEHPFPTRKRNSWKVCRSDNGVTKNMVSCGEAKHPVYKKCRHPINPAIHDAVLQSCWNCLVIAATHPQYPLPCVLAYGNPCFEIGYVFVWPEQIWTDSILHFDKNNDIISWITLGTLGSFYPPFLAAISVRRINSPASPLCPLNMIYRSWIVFIGC